MNFHRYSKATLLGVLFLVLGAANVHASITALSIRVYLQGAYQDGNMRAQLNNSGKQLLNMQFLSTGTNSLRMLAGATVPANAVDLVTVDVRAVINPKANVASKSGWLLSDGTVVEMNQPSSPLLFDVPRDAYYIVVNHRNHLSIMSARAITLGDETASVDFTQAGQVSKNSAQVQVRGKVVMVAGDVNHVAEAFEINALDVYSVQEAMQESPNGYVDADVTLDGVVNNDDLQLVNNNNSELYHSVLKP